MSEPAALLKLQSIDLDIIRARKRLDELPEKRSILAARAKLREVVGVREKAGVLLRKLEAELKARQDEIATIAEKIAHEQERLMGTSDHRQVQAITREMDGLKRRTDKLEMESLQYMERIEKANAQIETVEGALAKLKETEASLVERFKQVGGEVQQEIADLEAQRDRVAGSISAVLLGRYESAREAKGGIGVGTLQGVTCTACHMSLPAERIRDLQQGEDVGVCPQCRRLIVVRACEEGS